MRMCWLALLFVLVLCGPTRSLPTKKAENISSAPSGSGSPSAIPSDAPWNLPSEAPNDLPSDTPRDAPSVAPSDFLPSCAAPVATPSDRPSLCSSLQVGDPCKRDDRCGLGLSCNNYVCSERVALGEACDSDYDCADPNTCLNQVCVAGPVQQGGSCDSNRDCGIFEDGTTCISSVCTEQSGVGGPCEGDHTDCRNNLLCGNSNLCLAAEAGDICDEDSDCLGNLKCSPGDFYSSCQGSWLDNCFSGINTVDVKGRGIISMKDLNVNDWVRVSGDAYSRVHSFGHYQPDKETQYLQIEVADAGDKHHPLEITEEHLLFAHNRRTKKNTAVSAGSIKVGDFINTQNGEATRVSSISKVSRRGAYAPLTATGDIAVGGLLASNYVSRAWLKDHVSGQITHWLQHGASLPHRLYCQVVDGCQDETYNDNTGFSQWVMFWYKVEQWQLSLHPSLQILVLIFLAVPATLTVVVGIVSSPIFTSFSTIITSHLFTCIVGYLVWEKVYRKKATVRASKNDTRANPSQEIFQD